MYREVVVGQCYVSTNWRFMIADRGSVNMVVYPSMKLSPCNTNVKGSTGAIK